ncbi:cysteine dioxygenase family protein [Streptomyces sp. NPDC046261]|uniref:cysteine dioxygenase family protein n=1 Tax=Streptomyces sp. NPDC046261 TaxID=3157200 RepID=UPI0033E1AB0C
MTPQYGGSATLTQLTGDLAALVAAVREAVAGASGPASAADLVAGRLRPFLTRPGLLTESQCEGDPAGYRQHVLHTEPDGSFSVVALVWLPGQETPVHDHVSWCVTGVHEGEETEHRYRVVGGDGGERLLATEEVVNSAGEADGFAPPGDIHVVRNSGATRAISLHVYGADVGRLGSSIRRVYPHPRGCARS